MKGVFKLIKSKRVFTSASDITDMVKTRLYFNKHPLMFEFVIQSIINKANENVTDVDIYNLANKIKKASSTTDNISDIMNQLEKCTYTIYYEVIENEAN